ncbi:transporter substrate-binding domain-containing protein [Endozoicomonas sp. SM1973]|uniref:Transporter substrate-binding domain-containing protein n=1 Tax=Spartinivicinus marinus TaxID=2994442 RepID=A0A853I9C9_9GAMM|nr:transporter substrate-binding domain-containing protein [Spartinivicinus marinus]
MKKIVEITLLTALSFSAFSEEEKLIRITTGEYPPWLSKSYKHGGFVQHIITEAFKHKGYKTKYDYHPWARNYKEGQKQHYHATAFWYKSEAREKLFYYSDALYSEDVVFFHLKTTLFDKWHSLEDLKPYRIGATRGYTYTHQFWDAYKTKKLNIIISNSDQINFKMLLKRRIDLFVMASVAGYATLQQEVSTSQLLTITYNPKPLSSNTTHLLFYKKHQNSKKLLAIFNEGLRYIKKSGFYEKHYDLLLEGRYYQQ